MDRNYIVELIKANRLQEALKALEEASKGGYLHNDIINISAAFSARSARSSAASRRADSANDSTSGRGVGRLCRSCRREAARHRCNDHHQTRLRSPGRRTNQRSARHRESRVASETECARRSIRSAIARYP